MGGSTCGALGDRLNQPNQRVGGPLLRGAVLEMPTTDCVRIFAEKLNLDPHERPL